MQVFYAEWRTDSNIVALSEEESYHAARVLRLGVGQQLLITNGRGDWCKGSLIVCNHKECLVEITEKGSKPQRPVNLHLALAPTKNIDRFEWFLEKATECGIDEITPIFCDFSERTSIKPDRLKKILISAMKQSLRAYLPVLNPEIKFKAFIQKDFKAVKMIAHCKNGSRNGIAEHYLPGQNALLLIGPEGDFSDDEVQAALNKGYQPVTMGQYRLRTETAALAGCVQLNLMNGLL
ncbi:MAG TPA: 16S rRNA (uracil(1498)-N(3))-methyltransferase [Bacteroidales bacterium]|nr:16S rRNA (uracil(1498)-N(3))-methyltransferase [Bacteroidales bacterium]